MSQEPTDISAQIMLKALKRIAFRSSLNVRAKSLGSKDSHLLQEVHAIASNAIAEQVRA